MIFPGTENFSLKRQELVSCGSSGVLSQLGLWCNTGAGLRYLGNIIRGKIQIWKDKLEPPWLLEKVTGPRSLS